MIVNKFAKKCQCCGVMVPVGAGFAYNNGSRWFTACASTACHRNLGIEVHQSVTAAANVRRLTEDGKIYMPYDREAIPLLRSFPGAKFNPENLPKDKVYWAVSMRPQDLPRVLELADQLQLEVPESLREADAAGTEESRAAITRAKALCCNGKRPFEFQIEGIKTLALHDRFFLADDMGLGKTLQAIVALPDNERVLVICPATLKYNWRDEIQLWRPGYRVTICSGKEETVAKALAEGKKTKAIPFKIPEPGEIVIVNYDILPTYLAPTKDSGKVSKKGKSILVANLTQEQESALSETTVIGDEFHLVKNYKTTRAQRVGQITRISRRVWALSGTPLMNKPQDLFGVLSVGNMNPFGSWDNFLRLFNGYKNQWGGYEFGGPMPEVPERVQRVMLRRLKSEVLKDLPPKVYQDIEVDCDGILAKKLDTFLGKVTGRKAHLQPIDYDSFDTEFEAEELPDFSEFSEIRAMLAEARIPAMLEVVASYEDSGTPLVVFSAHKKPIETLQERPGWKIITGDTDPEERRNIVSEFQEGKLKGVALTIKAGGVGITLTRATNMLFVDLDWTPSWNIQAEDRLVRIGASGSHVLIMRMRSNHPLDRHIQKLLAYKIELAYRALEASIKFNPPPPRMPGVAVIEETDAELMARINSAGVEAEREMALGKLQRILGRESAKVNDVPEPELTPGRKEMLRGALDYMISVCDGAETRDSMGFNKPDAFIARWVGMCLREEDDVSYRVLERILVRYRRQLKGKFAEIWKPALGG
jgi:SWI/SNF-related matrix-associated actin-dependent regulator 1 of chromatin subfamily A